jgi:anhydro-N-acetylmuramic acid kinase
MPPTRLLVGLSVASGRDAVDAALVRAAGVGLGMTPRVYLHVRHPLLPHVRATADLRGLGDAFTGVTRQLVGKAGIDLRNVLAVGLFAPPGDRVAAAAEWVADRTGVTVATAFGDRDAAAGGCGTLVTPAADFLLCRSDAEDRLLIQLGGISSVLLLPAGGKVTALVGFETGPGAALLDAIAYHGSRGRDSHDSGGTKAVQGKCLDDLLAAWLANPFLLRKPPKAVPPGEFGDAFLTAAFDAARAAGGTLNDLLCTATHFIARCVGAGVRQFAPPATGPRSVYVGGGGVRNGFLWQALQQQFPTAPLRKLDEIGVPALAREAAAAAVLTALTLDGVTGNLPLLTGASGGRLVGRFVPGDPRNWAAVTAWAAEQLFDYSQLPRAA